MRHSLLAGNKWKFEEINQGPLAGKQSYMSAKLLEIKGFNYKKPDI
jgi:hypothetical protein